MNCEYAGRLNAFYDGELPSAEREALQAHLAGCSSCRQEMERLRALSDLVRGVGPGSMAQGVLRRLHERIDAAPEVVVVRLTERLMAAAAAVLLASCLWLWEAQRTEAAVPIENWERTLISQRLPAAQEPVADDPVIRWVVADLSEGDQQ